MKKIGHFEAYVDFVSVVLLCAPDEFPRRDFLSEDEQMNLDRAFEALLGNFSLVEDRISEESVRTELRQTLDAALVAYKAGDEIRGARNIQAFEKLLITNGRRSR